MIGVSISDLAWVHIGQTIAFTVGIVLINMTDRSARLWVVANFIGILGLAVVALDPLASWRESLIVTLGHLIALELRAVAQCDGPLLARRNRLATALIALSILCIPVLITFWDSDYRLFTTLICAMAALSGAGIYLYANRKWSGLPGQKQMLAIFAAVLVLLVFMLSYSYPLGASTHDYQARGGGAELAGAIAGILVALMAQAFFANLLLGRKARLALLAGRRTTRSKERARNLLAGRETIERLADERLNLLQMMTHEVRQPLNNAQAALQAMLDETNAREHNVELARHAAVRVQLVLDEVILSLSNSIVAARMIEWRDKPVLVTAGAGETLALAVMDCPGTETGRLSVANPADEIFVQADPVLLRLALRNLLANALKYSPSGSQIEVMVLLDDERFGVAFRITNAVSDPRLLLGNLFARGKRGMDVGYEGFGLGLFMANETARIHNGELTYWQSRSDEVTFELFLPA